MSQENVDLYRQGIDTFNRRDLQAFLALADPDVVGVSRLLALEGGTLRGHDGARQWWDDLLGVFPDFTMEVVSVRDAGRLTVSALRNRAHGEGSGAPSSRWCGRSPSGATGGWFDGRCTKASRTPSTTPGCGGRNGVLAGAGRR